MEKCTEEQIDIYEKIEKWKSYVNERGATLFWVYTQKEKDMYNKLQININNEYNKRPKPSPGIKINFSQLITEKEYVGDRIILLII